jgi:hypothetical protein
MEAIVFYINSEQSKQNALLSLANIGPEIKRETALLFVTNNEYYLEMRNLDPQYFEGIIYDDLMFITTGEDSLSHTVKGVLNNLYTDLIIINPTHILKFGAISEMRRTFNGGHYGFIGNSLKSVGKAQDLYSNPVITDLIDVAEYSEREIDVLTDMTFITSRQNFDYYCDDDVDFGIQLRKLGFKNILDKNIPIMEGK